MSPLLPQRHTFVAVRPSSAPLCSLPPSLCAPSIIMLRFCSLLRKLAAVCEAVTFVAFKFSQSFNVLNETWVSLFVSSDYFRLDNESGNSSFAQNLCKQLNTNIYRVLFPLNKKKIKNCFNILRNLLYNCSFKSFSKSISKSTNASQKQARFS